MAQGFVSFRKPAGNLRATIRLLEHAADCQDFAMTAPVIYLNVGQTSYCLRLQSATGPGSGEVDAIQARRILGALLDAGITASGRMPKSEHFLRPIKKDKLEA